MADLNFAVKLLISSEFIILKPIFFFTFKMQHMKFRGFIHLLIIQILPFSLFAQIQGQIDLTGTWQFRQQGSQKIYNGQVPGYVQTDLFRNKIIPDPYFRDNEQKVQWISDTGWVYEKYFNIEPSFFEHRNMELVFEGLDTYANVYLNDSLWLWPITCSRPGSFLLSTSSATGTTKSGLNLFPLQRKMRDATMRFRINFLGMSARCAVKPPTSSDGTLHPG